MREKEEENMRKRGYRQSVVLSPQSVSYCVSSMEFRGTLRQKQGGREGDFQSHGPTSLGIAATACLRDFWIFWMRVARPVGAGRAAVGTPAGALTRLEIAWSSSGQGARTVAPAEL